MKTFLGRDKYDWIAAGLVALITMVVITSCEAAHARGSIEESRAVRAILGEAPPGAGEAVLSAFAHAIRNRGSLRGVFGYYKGKDARRLQAGRNAWTKSILTPDATRGATHWLSTHDIKHCRPGLIAWRHKMINTLYSGDTYFYKEI